MISAGDVRAAADRSGLSLVALLSAERVNASLSGERERLAEWQKKGHAGEMRYMERPPGLFTGLEHFLPTVRTVAAFSLSYLHEPLHPEPCPPLHGRVARYAWGLDYHQVLKEKLEQFAGELRRRESFEYRIFSDSVPLLERAIGAAGGLGFAGKNTLLIRPGVGSFTFLAEVLLSIECEELIEDHRGSGCGSCFRCGSSCPTGAIVSPNELDAPKCISYLTIEKRTEFSPWESAALGEWIFGCDICQEVCPFNNEGVERSPAGEFGQASGVGMFLNLREVLSLRDNGSYLARFKGTALLRAKREQLIRNACAVIGNRGFEELEGPLREVAEADPSELARNSAFRALQKLRVSNPADPGY